MEDSIPGEQVVNRSDAEAKEHEDQLKFLRAVETTNAFLDSVGVPRAEQMIVSGGAVYMHQRRERGHGDRIPTDLDYVLLQKQTDLDAMEKMEARARDFFPNSELVLEPRTHHGYVFSNPIMHAVTEDGFPIDIANQWITTFPIDHPVLPGMTYAYPTDDPEFFRLARDCRLSDKADARVAHPGYVAFYKTMMSRNLHGKQDNQDLKRLKDLGLLAPNDEMMAMLRLLGYNNEDVIQKVLQRLQSVQ